MTSERAHEEPASKSGLREKLRSIAAKELPASALDTLIVLQTEAVERVAKAPALSPIETSDREDQLADWLDEADVPGGWELAPVFVQAGLDTAWLDRVAAAVDPDLLTGALKWVHCAVETELLINEIEDATGRISTLVGAAKQYSQLDRAPYQVADVQELLDSTLMMLGAKIGDGITVVRDYAPGLPRIPAYAAELNQVWTNLVDNAVDAMGGTGTLTVRTAMDTDRNQILVEIGDTGPGIPAEIRNRIFEPFFTTKDVGQGTGLGLDISWRIVVKKHHGDIRVESHPGDTRFQVRLPLTPAEGEIG